MFKQILLGGFLVTSLLFGAPAVQAIDLTDGLTEAGGDGGAGYDINQELPVLVGKIIQVAIGILGVLFLVLTIFAGFTWMTAGGDEKKVAKAKGILTTAVIGLVIVLAAYSITAFIVGQIGFATQGGIESVD